MATVTTVLPLPSAAPAERPEERFQRFVQTYRTQAVRLAWRLCGGDNVAAEDVAQEAFLRAWRALPRFRDEARLETWFFRILVRTAHNHRRALRRQSPSPSPLVEQAHPPLVNDPGLQRRIAIALETLSRRQRESFVLVHLQGFTVTETASILKRSPGTVKTHLHRALSRLREELGDLGGVT